ncbi:electron transfer flavoprotein subunit alpha/FixB family protein [Arthrobacter castelli]|uniref:electron transfer flavoprotein subunit alpha/FixB family protein n=1 Tax=Arthrobacter castelli TaxID=271431 RepID=UPI0004034C15|nr:electron transfer flavoprotein subunit alpha/FixB family protein [Arthrobacter castelli]
MILVLVETGADGAAVTSLETLTFARQLAGRLGTQSVEAMVTGSLEAAATVRDQLAAQGVESVHHAGGPGMDRYSAGAWATALAAVPSDYVMAAGTPRGSEILAHVAARAGTSMAANVVDVVDTDPVTVSRQVMGGAAFEQMRVDGSPTVITVAGHAVEPADAARPSDPAWREFEPELTEADLATAVVRVEEGEADNTSALTGARVVVGAGRGVGGADDFDDLLELTDLLGATLGASRVVTSLGWRPHYEQIGQTGSRISPDVYIACGISGAVQHWAGCQSAKTIVAINTDADAPMVTGADYAIVGDLHEVVPAINEELRRRTAPDAAE